MFCTNLHLVIVKKIRLITVHILLTMSALVMITAVLASLAADAAASQPCRCSGEVMYCAGLQLMEVPTPPSPTLQIKVLSLQVVVYCNIV